MSTNKEPLHEVDILDSHTQHNSRTNICGTLPSELLAEVFAYLSIMDQPDRYAHWRQKHCPSTSSWKLGWIAVTHVCRHWRTVALDFPHLWADISYCLGANWTRLMLERAKFATVSIRQCSSTKGPMVAGEEIYIPEHIDRIEVLDLCGTHGEFKKIFDNLHRIPAYKLRKLSVRAKNPTDTDSVEIIDLHDGIFGGYAPKLRILQVHGTFRLSATAPWLRNLHTLDLKLDFDSQDGLHALPTVTQFFDLLDHLPRLQSLSLRNYMPVFPTVHSTLRNPLTPCRTVKLPDLHWLDIEGDYSRCLSLIQSVIWSRHNFWLSLHCEQPRSPPTQHAHLDVLFEVAKLVWNCLVTFSHIESLSIQGPNWHPDVLESTLEITASTNSQYVDPDSKEKTKTRYKIIFDMPDPESQEVLDDPLWDISTILENYCAIMPLEGVRHLDLNLPEAVISPEQFVENFGLMKNLRTLDIQGMVAAGLPSALRKIFSTPEDAGATQVTTESESPSTSTPSDILFPRLRELNISYYNLRRAFGSRFLDLLCDALEYRAKRSKKLPRLTFQDTMFTNLDWIARCRVCVKQLFIPYVWDDDDPGDCYIKIKTIFNDEHGEEAVHAPEEHTDEDVDTDEDDDE